MDKKIFSLSKHVSFKIYPKSLDINKKWQLRYYFGGKPYKLIRKLNTFTSTEDRFNYIEHTLKPEAFDLLIKEGVSIPKGIDMVGFGELSKALDKRRLKYEDSSIRNYKSKCRVFCRWNTKPLATLTPTDVENFTFFLHDEQKLTNKTINNYIVSLRKSFEYLIKDKVLITNPFTEYENLKAHSVGFDYYSLEQIQTIREYLQDIGYQWLLLACYFQFYCFVRPGNELRNIQVGDIDTHKAKLLIKGKTAKGHVSQIIPIPIPLNNLLKSLDLSQYSRTDYLFRKDGPSKGSIGRDYWAKKHQPIIKLLGFNSSRYKFYSWKHSGAVAFIRAGGHLKELQLRMRHKSPEYTDIYLQRLGINSFDVDNVPIPDITQAPKPPVLSQNDKLAAFLNFADKEKLKIFLEISATQFNHNAEMSFYLKSLSNCL